jgi:hypothetical protein
MPMNEPDRLSVVIRFVAAGAGLVGGAMSGTILILLLMILTGSTFGLTKIWPGTVIGAIVGSVLGFLFPRIGRSLIGLFARM